jgi:preprotein translocase subunit SecG
MIILLTIIHVIVCFFLVVVVLLQSGKAADLAGAFGGMGSQTAFGPRGAATILTKATAIAAALFMVTSLTLSVMASRAGRGGGGSTVLEKSGAAPKSATPAQPKQPPVQIQTPGGAVQIDPNPAKGAPPAPAEAPAPDPAKKK